jgi:hypothetical protein
MELFRSVGFVPFFWVSCLILYYFGDEFIWVYRIVIKKQGFLKHLGFSLPNTPIKGTKWPLIELFLYADGKNG